MLQNLLHASFIPEAIIWILFEKFIDKIFRIVTDLEAVLLVWEVDRIFSYHTEHSVLLVMIEWWYSNKHLIHESAKGPPINHKVILCLMLKHFRC